MGATVREVVSRREAQRLLQLRRSARRGRQRRQGRVLLGGRAEGRAAHDHLCRPAGRSRALRERAEEPRRRKGYAGRHLHGHGSRIADCDARLRSTRSAAHRRVRGLLQRVPVGSHERHGVRGADHAGRGVASGQEGAAEAECRRSRCAGGDGEGGRCLEADGRRRPVRSVTRRVVARARRRARRRSELCASRADGRRRSALSPLHVGDDREAQGDRAHDGRLSRRRRGDAPLHLRRQARLRLLVCGRRRLGDRTQLHRLRPPRERNDGCDVRGRSELSESGALVGDHRALQGRHPLHGADCDPLAHEVGPGARPEARSLVVAAPRQRRRADQSGGVDLVSRAHRWTPGGRPRPG